MNDKTTDFDRELMLRAGRGEDDAFEALVERHQRGLVNFFRRLGAGKEQTEDLMQETLLKLHRARSGWEPRARFTTFLYTLARNVRIDWLRRLERQHIQSGKAPEEAQPAAPDNTLQTALRLDIQMLLTELSDPHREILVLAVVQGFKYAEIAAMLEIPLGTVRSRLHKATRRLEEVAREKDWRP